MLLAPGERALGSLSLGSDISDCDMSGLHQLLGLNPQVTPTLEFLPRQWSASPPSHWPGPSKTSLFLIGFG